MPKTKRKKAESYSASSEASSAERAPKRKKAKAGPAAEPAPRAAAKAGAKRKRAGGESSSGEPAEPPAKAMKAADAVGSPAAASKAVKQKKRTAAAIAAAEAGLGAVLADDPQIEAELRALEEQESGRVLSLPIAIDDMRARNGRRSVFSRGAITRIHLNNFKSVTDLVVTPGAKLNILVGPNGAGKSSIMEAVFLCLGTKSDRSTDVLKLLQGTTSFAGFLPKRAGVNNGFVEVTLFDPVGNKTVRMELSREHDDDPSPKRKWFINNVSVKASDVYELATDMGIQVENLCQFLPQFRVSEFAKLDSKALLDQTALSIDKEKLYDEKAVLVALRSAHRSADASKASMVSELRNEEHNLARMGEAKLAHEQRALQEARLVLVKQTVLLCSLQVRKSQQDAANEEHAVTMAAYTKAKEAVEAAKAKLAEIKDSVEALEQDAASKEKDLAAVDKRFAASISEVTSLRSDLAGLMEAKRDLSKDIQEAIQKRATLEDRKRIAQEQLNTMPSAAATTASNDRIRAALRDNTAQLAELDSEDTANKRMGGALEARITAIGKELQALRSSRDLRLETFRQRAPRWLLPRVERTLAWIEKNKDKLTGAVYGPVIVEFDIQDPFMQSILESVMNNEDLAAFVFEAEEDLHRFEAFQKTLAARDRLSNCTNAPPGGIQRPPVDPSTVGLDGFFSECDTVVAPPAVMASMIVWKSLNMVGYIRTSDDARGLSVAERLAARHPKVRVVTERSVIVNYTGRLGGDSAREVNTLRRSQASAVGASEEDRQALETERHGLVQRLNGLREQVEARKAPRLELMRAKDQLSTESQSLKNGQRMAEKLRATLQQIENELGEVPVVDEAAAKSVLNGKIKTKSKNVVDKAAAVAVIAAAISDKRGALVRALLSCARLTAEVDRRRDEVQITAAAEKETARAAQKTGSVAEKAAADFKAAKADVKANLGKISSEQRLDMLMTETIRVCGEQEDHGVQNFTRTMEALQTEQRSLQAKLDNADRGVFSAVEYERVKALVASLTERLANADTEVGRLKERLETKGQEWRQRLKRIVAQIDFYFSRFFASMDCGGEVRLAEANLDFENYGIEIVVRFQTHQNKQVLGNFQSGGERAVSTIMYLIAMQELAIAPFRIVDEINQGVDPKFERKVLEKIIDRATRERAPQSFYVTPKLLFDLPYVPEVTFLCVCAGKYMVPQKELDLPQTLARVKAKGAAEGRAKAGRA